MSNAPRKTPFAVGERVGMWVVLEILPPLGDRLRDNRYLAVPDCCGQPAKMMDQTLIKGLYPSGANKGWCLACSDRLRREVGAGNKLPVREGYVHATPPSAAAAPEVVAIDPDPADQARAQLALSQQFLCQPIPAGLQRNLWGHPWAP